MGWILFLGRKEKGEKMRLIDADTILNGELMVVSTVAYDAVRAIIEKINNAPTVDAEPVRHGKWTHTKWSNMRHDYSCSLCGCRISGVDPFSLSATAYYYCPECGAKMDEVEDG